MKFRVISWIVGIVAHGRPMGGAWLSLHLWDHYDYTRDRLFLARTRVPGDEGGR